MHALVRDGAGDLAARPPDPQPIAWDALRSDAQNTVYDAIVHLAGIAHVDPSIGASVMMAANADMTADLVAIARARSIPRFIHASSILAIAPNAGQVPVDDQTRPAPDTDYGRSKLAAEGHVATLADDGALAVSLRPPLVIGWNARGNWASLQKLANTPLPLPFAVIDNRRSLVSIQALCAAIAMLVDRPVQAERSGAYAIADPEPVSTPTIVHRLRAGMGRPRRLFPVPTAAFGMIGRMTGGQRRLAGLTGDFVVDASRFDKTFDFAPPMPISEALAESGRLYRAERERQK